MSLAANASVNADEELAHTPFGLDSLFLCLAAVFARRDEAQTESVTCTRRRPSPLLPSASARRHSLYSATCRLEMKIIWQRLDSRSEAIESIQAGRSKNSQTHGGDKKKADSFLAHSPRSAGCNLMDVTIHFPNETIQSACGAPKRFA